MRKSFLIAMTGMVLLAGCSSKSAEGKPTSFSPADMCIQKVKDTKVKICYGDSKADVEKLWGEGSPGPLKMLTSYDPGVALSYRDDKVALLQLNEESAGKVETATGVQVGISPKDMEKIYTNEHAVKGGRDVSYYYSLEEKKLLDTPLSPSEGKEALEKVMLFAYIVSGDDIINRVMMMDQRMGSHMD